MVVQLCVTDLRQLIAVKHGFGPDWIPIPEITGGNLTLRLVPDDLPIKGTIDDLEGKPLPGATVKVGEIVTSETGDLRRVWEEWPRNPMLALRRNSAAA